MKEALLELKGVWKKYDMGHAEPLIVLRDINLEINKGDFVVITGPSGSGKSTMVNMVGALDRPSFGQILLKGKDIEKLNDSDVAVFRGETIGFIFQQFNLLQTFSALENVMLPMKIINAPDDSSRERAAELLNQLGLLERMNHKPNELSGGQQQRVAIARALANNPEIVLADEPTGNLDTKTGRFVMDFLKKLNENGKTVILITHDLELVKYGTRIIYIRDGQVEKEVENTKTHKSVD
jgi:putative ABC transport system ATP-binding protein